MFSRPRATSPRASRQHLAVLGRDQRGDLLAVGVDELAQVEHHLGPPARGRWPATPGTPPWPRRRRRRPRRRLARSTLAACSPVAGLNTERRTRPDVPARRTPPSIQWLMLLDAALASTVGVDRPQTRYWRQAALDVLAVAGAPGERVVLDDHPAAAESTVSTLPSISKPSHAEWSMFMWCFLLEADRRVAGRVPDDDVGVGAGGDDPLLRVHAEHARRRRAARLDPALQA